jgi:DNA-binding NarL/FixJ family response regulator
VTRILIADNHPVVLYGIRGIVAGADDLRIADEAEDGRQLLERASKTEHDLVLLDLSMPDIDGLDLLKALRRERPKVPVLVLSMCDEDALAIRALKAGAAGYVMKSSPATELLGAMRRVAAGGRYVSPSVAEKIAGHLAGDGDKRPHEKLSDREYQVLRMIASGKSTRQISTELSLSVKTVSTYRARIFEKMQMKSPANLAAYVVRNRLD